jgi:hypothetical protein
MKCFCSLSLEGILNAIFAQHHSHRRRRRRRSETKANRILFFHDIIFAFNEAKERK